MEAEGFFSPKQPKITLFNQNIKNLLTDLLKDVEYETLQDQLHRGEVVLLATH